jgi:hypothetical protein
MNNYIDALSIQQTISIAFLFVSYRLRGPPNAVICELTLSRTADARLASVFSRCCRSGEGW